MHIIEAFDKVAWEVTHTVRPTSHIVQLPMDRILEDVVFKHEASDTLSHVYLPKHAVKLGRDGLNKQLVEKSAGYRWFGQTYVPQLIWWSEWPYSKSSKHNTSKESVDWYMSFLAMSMSYYQQNLFMLISDICSSTLPSSSNTALLRTPCGLGKLALTYAYLCRWSHLADCSPAFPLDVYYFYM